MKVKTAFMPQLAIDSGITNIEFYEKAFGAKEQQRITNNDGSIHVVIFTIDEALFVLHEVTPWSGTSLPNNGNSTTVTVGLLVDDVHAVVNSAVEAGAILVTPVTDHDYGWRQGTITDPFGHR